MTAHAIHSVKGRLSGLCNDLANLQPELLQIAAATNSGLLEARAFRLDEAIIILDLAINALSLVAGRNLPEQVV